MSVRVSVVRLGTRRVSQASMAERPDRREQRKLVRVGKLTRRANVIAVLVADQDGIDLREAESLGGERL